MISTPKKSVTRFFIPLIDVLILLFCIFLLMPFVSGPDTPEPTPEAKAKAEAKPLPADVETLQAMLATERAAVARLEKERTAKVTDRLAVRVLEIDPRNGTLFYYDPDRREVKSDADAFRVIARQKSLAGKDGVKDPFFLILYPRAVTPYPTVAQKKQIEEWFKGEAFGFDIPQ